MEIPKLGIKVTRVKRGDYTGEFVVDYGVGETTAVNGYYFAVYKGGKRPKNKTLLCYSDLLLNDDLADCFETGQSDIYDPTEPFLCADMRTMLSVLASKYKSNPFVMLMIKIAAMNILTNAKLAKLGGSEPATILRVITSLLSVEELEVMELYQLGMNAAPDFIEFMRKQIIKNGQSNPN